MSELDVVEEAPEVEPVVDTENAELEAETTDDEVVEDTATSDEDDAEPEKEKPKRRSRAEERIHELTRKNYEAQRLAEAAQRQAAELQEYIRQQQTQPQQTEMPRLADFDHDETLYQQAMQSWNQQQWENHQRQQQAAMQAQAQQAQAMQEEQIRQAKIAEGTQKYPDFAVKISQLPPLREVNPAAYQAIMESDATVDVAYYLTENQDVVYNLASMSPVKAIREIARIEQLVTAKAPATTKVAPKPPARVKGNSEAVKDPNKMSTDEWMAWRNRQLKK